MYRNGSICMCSSKCTAWNCCARNRYVGGIGEGCHGGGHACGHKSRNSYSGRGCECEYGNMSSFSGGVDGGENWTVCSFQCRCGGAAYEYNMGCVVKFGSWHWSALMSLLIRYTHIPIYIRFSFTSSTLLIHHYTLRPHMIALTLTSLD